MRYIILIILNLPIIVLALTNVITQYKLKKISPQRFRWQLAMWLMITIILIASFPIYNILSGKDLFDSTSLSLFDVAEITAIVWLFYTVNYQRQRIAQNEKIVRDLHREVSIKFSEKN